MTDRQQTWDMQRVELVLEDRSIAGGAAGERTVVFSGETCRAGDARCRAGDAFCRAEDACCSAGDVEVRWTAGETLTVALTAGETPVRTVKIGLRPCFSAQARLLGDAWERSYGDLCWKRAASAGPMPWYFFAHEGGATSAYGVKVRPSALCLWKTEGELLWLILDVCNGTHGVVLGGRRVVLAEALAKTYADGELFDCCRDFCGLLCRDGIFPKQPVYGFNNWYFAYGKSSEEEILADADYLCELTAGLENRPYYVIDQCWARQDDAGPWDELHEGFFDMPKLADALRGKGIRPGIWLRPLFYRHADLPAEWALKRSEERDEVVLDVTHPQARRYVLDNFARLKEWGYELIKHDFTTYDIFGGFAFQFADCLRAGDWRFRDRSRTNAEIVRDFYADIKRTVGDTLIMGCNTLSHLIAGLAELQRIGDDTSGLEWERTRRMGVNTLAFRMCQHRVFYDVDADCVGITGRIDWEKNRQWMNLLAESGTPLFVSAKRGVPTPGETAEIKRAMRANSLQKDRCRPVDWLETEVPQTWNINGRNTQFHW